MRLLGWNSLVTELRHIKTDSETRLVANFLNNIHHYDNDYIKDLAELLLHNFGIAKIKFHRMLAKV